LPIKLGLKLGIEKLNFSQSRDFNFFLGFFLFGGINTSTSFNKGLLKKLEARKTEW